MNRNWRNGRFTRVLGLAGVLSLASGGTAIAAGGGSPQEGEQQGQEAAAEQMEGQEGEGQQAERIEAERIEAERIEAQGEQAEDIEGQQPQQQAQQQPEGQQAEGQQLQGDVVAIHEDLGLLELRTDEGLRAVRASPSDLEQIEEGEQLSLQTQTFEGALWVEEGSLSEEGEPRDMEEEPAERQTASGEVRSVDKWAGIIRLEDEAYRAHPAQLENIQPGQMVSVTYAEEEGGRWVQDLRQGAPAEGEQQQQQQQQPQPGLEDEGLDAPGTEMEDMGEPRDLEDPLADEPGLGEPGIEEPGIEEPLPGETGPEGTRDLGDPAQPGAEEDEMVFPGQRGGQGSGAGAERERNLDEGQEFEGDPGLHQHETDVSQPQDREQAGTDDDDETDL